MLKDPSAGIKLHQVPDIITPITDPKEEKQESSYCKDMKPPDQIPPFNSTPLVNGIETNPTLISNLLKEAPSVPHLPAVAATTQPGEVKDKSHKKKNKEKHKHKDKDRNKEEKEKKKKHKDKDREKHKHRDKHHEEETQEPPQPVVAEPIKLTIQKDRIQPVETAPNPTGSLKIKIPKDKIKTEPPRTELKIKIPKEVIGHFDYSGESSGGSKKRDRDRSSPTGGGVPPLKRKYAGEAAPKQNGRHSHSKVSNYNSNPPPRHQQPQQQQQQQQQQYSAIPSVYSQQPTGYYYYHHPGVQMAPNMIPHNMNVPPPTYMYHQQFYGQGYMYPHAAAAATGQEMYAAHHNPAVPQQAGGAANLPPPLPSDAPPVNPPPPPPE